jgi:hypothetical protein
MSSLLNFINKKTFGTIFICQFINYVSKIIIYPMKLPENTFEAQILVERLTNLVQFLQLLCYRKTVTLEATNQSKLILSHYAYHKML